VADLTFDLLTRDHGSVSTFEKVAGAIDKTVAQARKLEDAQVRGRAATLAAKRAADALAGAQAHLAKVTADSEASDDAKKRAAERVAQAEIAQARATIALRRAEEDQARGSTRLAAAQQRAATLYRNAGQQQQESAAKQVAAQHRVAAAVQAAAQRQQAAVPRTLQVSRSMELGERAAHRFSNSLTGLGGTAVRIAASGMERLSIVTASAMRGATLGLATAGFAAFEFGKSVVTLGIAYQDQLNVMQSVSHATAAEMVLVSAKARDLGNDLTLPATSAADAAQAMTELAKGNLTARQAMDAAKGTLQLAAAAQISGARAASIQADALNAFGLKATAASHVADVLANAANTATGEISDFAFGLQASAAVAHQFGLSLDDNVTALALFANAGIHGQDAGTSLKSALIALASPSKQAAKALDVLGVKAFDSSGRFVGLETIAGQLAAAHSRLTQATFTSATATAFGSDAARAAGVLAASGAKGWDAMERSISRSGGAANAARARMKGVGGAIAGLKSELETIKIDIFTAAAPALERFIRRLAQGLPDAIENVKAGFNDMMHPVQVVADGFHRAWDEAAPLGRVLADTGTAAGKLIDATKPLGELLPQVLGPIKPSLDAVKAGADAAKDAFTTMGPIIGETGTLMGSAITPMGPLLKATGEEARRTRLDNFFRGVGAAVANTIVFVRRNAATWREWAVNVGTAVVVAGKTLGQIGGWLSRNLGPPLQAMAGWWRTNKEAVAAFGAGALEVLSKVGGVFMIFAGIAVKAIGAVIEWNWRLVHIVLDAYALILHGAAAAFGWIPNVGAKLKGARDEFDRFSRGVDVGMKSAAAAAQKTGDGLITLGRRTYDAADAAARLRARMLELHDRRLVIEAIDRAKPVAERIQRAISQVQGKRINIVVNQVGSIQNIQREINALTGKAVSIQVGAVRTGIGANAEGTRDWRGGWTVVGERGPELVNLPRGSDIYNHTDTRAMLTPTRPAVTPPGGTVTLNATFNVTAAPGQHPAETGAEVYRVLKEYLRRAKVSLA
jgi:TP901 family phage tail tape measure protein